MTKRLLSAVIVLCGCVDAASAARPTADPNNPPHVRPEDYPAESKTLHEEGNCRVKLTVSAEGVIGNITLTQSSGYPRLDEACLKAFAEGGLLPARIDGKPVDSTVEVPITWKLPTPPKPGTAPIRIDPANLPHIGEAYYPRASARLKEEGRCKVQVTVTAAGKIRDVSLTQSTGYPRLDKACLRAFESGGLLPAVADSKPVDATTEIPITWVLQ